MLMSFGHEYESSKESLSHIKKLTLYLRNGLLSIDFGSKSVVINNQEVHLTPNEFSLLELLSNHKGKVLTYEMILKRIYGYVNKTEMPEFKSAYDIIKTKAFTMS